MSARGLDQLEADIDAAERAADAVLANPAATAAEIMTALDAEDHAWDRYDTVTRTEESR
jgi:hypothetical protein